MSEGRPESVHRTEMLQAELENTIDRCLQESDMTWAELLGVLRVVALKCEHQMMEDEDPEE